MITEKAKPATAVTVNGLLKSEQLGGRLDIRNSEPLPNKQVPSIKNQLILVLWSLVALVTASAPK
jgi:hypothetical protein